MLEFTTKLNNLIWSVPMMFLILGAGIFFTVATRVRFSGCGSWL